MLQLDCWPDSLRGKSLRSALRCGASSDSPEAIEAVVGEFVRDLSDIVHLPKSGRDFALETLSTLVRQEDQEAVQAAMERDVGQEFEAFISGCLPSAVAIMLKDEHPQARATALLLMGADNASKVLFL